MLLPDFTNIQYGYAAVIGNLLNRYGLFKKRQDTERPYPALTVHCHHLRGEGWGMQSLKNES